MNSELYIKQHSKIPTRKTQRSNRVAIPINPHLSQTIPTSSSMTPSTSSQTLIQDQTPLCPRNRPCPKTTSTTTPAPIARIELMVPTLVNGPFGRCEVKTRTRLRHQHQRLWKFIVYSLSPLSAQCASTKAKSLPLRKIPHLAQADARAWYRSLESLRFSSPRALVSSWGFMGGGWLCVLCCWLW